MGKQGERKGRSKKKKKENKRESLVQTKAGPLKRRCSPALGCFYVLPVRTKLECRV